jgi:hypothetical protein
VLWRRILVCLLVCAVTAAEVPARPAGAAVFGVVTQSSDAHVGEVKLSPGSTIFDGESLSTGGSGAIGIRGSASRLYVPALSGVTLHVASTMDLANLNAGTLVFSSAKASAIQIVALDAQICPAADGPTVAQISIVGPKLLQIVARQGALQFSYRGESEPIPEGSSIRVVLDPPDDPQTAQTTSPFPHEKTKKQGRRRRGFLFLLWGVPGAIAAIGIHAALESPDRP